MPSDPDALPRDPAIGVAQHARDRAAGVAELASFTRAAKQLGLTKARVSNAVQQLEAQLGTRLLHRTTRTVRLTPDAEACVERCRVLLADADELQAMFQRSPAALRERVRVDLPNGVACGFVIPRLPEFLTAHSLVEIEQSATDGLVDVVHEGFDFVLRVGALRDSGLVAIEGMPGFTPPPMPVSLPYPNRRHLAKRVQALMDWLAEVLLPQLEAA